MLRYIGLICIFLFAFYLILRYERYQKTLLLQGEEILRLLKFLQNEMDGLARPLPLCIGEFRSAAIGDTLDSLKKGQSPSEVLAGLGALSLPAGMGDAISSFAASFGRGGRREEARRLSDAVSRIEPLVAAEREESARRLRLFRTLTTASAIGLVILLI